MLDAILSPRVLAVLGAIGLALFAFSFAWAFFKVSFQNALKSPVPRNWFTNGCDVLAEIGANLPGAINRALKLAGKPGLFLPTQPADGSAPTASAATIDVLSTENAALREALAALQRRVSESHAVTAPPPFDPHARQTVVPPQRDDGQRGSVECPSLLACIVVAIVAGALLAGCPVVREAAMRAAPGVPDPVDCRPGVQRCDGLVPVVCSTTGREWPALPRSASGEPRTCAPGVCVVSDGGVAHCALAADGGGP